MPDRACMIADFGLSGIVNDANDYMTTRCGSPFYAAPEVRRRSNFNFF
jgi:serine/threonine protein kinase